LCGKKRERRGEERRGEERKGYIVARRLGHIRDNYPYKSILNHTPRVCLSVYLP
jgi:hypothetical protein